MTISTFLPDFGFTCDARFACMAVSTERSPKSDCHLFDRSIASIDLSIEQDRGFFHVVDEFTNIQNGLRVLDRTLKEQQDLAKRIIRVRAKASRYSHQIEHGTSMVLRDS